VKNRPLRQRLGFAAAGIRSGVIDLLHASIPPENKIIRNIIPCAVLIVSIGAFEMAGHS